MIMLPKTQCICSKLALSTLAFLFVISVSVAQTYQPTWESLNSRKIPAWFSDSKFGIFIHWGVYAVPSFARPTDYSEWYWYTLQHPDRDMGVTAAFHRKHYGQDFPYSNFEKSFTAELYDPEQWASIFKASGAKYVVLTSKHHEGYCLWDSKEADKAWGRPWNAVSGTPKRDLLGDLTTAVKNQGMKMGYYYSLYEWNNPLWLNNKEAYIKEVLFPQFKDLVTRYEPSIIFSDGEWDLSDTTWCSTELLAWLYNESAVGKEVVVNDRWGKATRSKNPSTYATSEYGSGMGPDVVWEESRGIGNSYGYNRMEALSDYKSSHDLILALVDIVSRGGNLLLDVGPTADGRIPVIMQQRLEDIGNWLKTNGDAIYHTHAWKITRQWSQGARPEIKEGNYDTKYDIAELVKPKSGQANIELFFTSSGSDLYCIAPSYSKTIKISDYKLPKGAVVQLLSARESVKVKQQGNDCVFDLSSFTPGSIPAEMLVFKITNGAQ